MTSPLATAAPDRKPQRVQHEIRRRLLTVHSVQPLGSNMLRIVFTSPDLAGFYSPGFGDHVKLLLPQPGQATPDLSAPLADNDNAAKPVMRDYTPRAFDPQTNLLTIDFALHEAGPATSWARQAQPGQQVGIGGPRGSLLIPTCFDWHLLIGDETALPAISRRLEELPSDAKVVVIAEVAEKAAEIKLPDRAMPAVHWAHRDKGESLLAALAGIKLPDGDYHAWVACESSAAKAIRAALIADHKANPQWLRAAGYWRRGTPGAHDKIED